MPLQDAARLYDVVVAQLFFKYSDLFGVFPGNTLRERMVASRAFQQAPPTSIGKDFFSIRPWFFRADLVTWIHDW